MTVQISKQGIFWCISQGNRLCLLHNLSFVRKNVTFFHRVPEKQTNFLNLFSLSILPPLFKLSIIHIFRHYSLFLNFIRLFPNLGLTFVPKILWENSSWYVFWNFCSGQNLDKCKRGGWGWRGVWISLKNIISVYSPNE